MQNKPAADLLSEVFATRFPDEEYRTFPGVGNAASSVWRVGVQQDWTWPFGWVVESSVTLGADARVVASLSVFGNWQGGGALASYANLEWGFGGRVWIPWPRFNLSFIDAEATGNDSTVRLYARPACPGEYLPDPVLQGIQLQTIAAGAPGVATVTVPNGATEYRIDPGRQVTANSVFVVLEQFTAGGGTPPVATYGFDDRALAAGAAHGGSWRPVPPQPTPELLLANVDAVAAMDLAIRWRYNLLAMR